MSEVKKNYDGPIESLESLQEEESSFNFKNMLSIFILNWKWFLLSMFIFVCGALIYLRYTDSVYQVTAKMLIKEETSNRRYNGSALAFAFKVPSNSSMGTSMAVYTTSSPALKSNVTGSGTSFWSGNGYSDASGGSSVSLSNYSSGGGHGPGGGGRPGNW